jgi:hypothetical protein
MKKISASETTKLYAFTRAHYVEYYDLQTELVDHLANGIELLWVEKPNLTFEEALQVEFKKFGIFGFTDLVTERQKKMSKRYNKLILSILKNYFTIPRLFLTTMLMLLMYLFLNTVVYREYVVIGLFLLSILIVLSKTIAYRIKQKRNKETAKKLWMFEDIIYSHGQSFALFQAIVLFPPHLLRTDNLFKVMNYSVGLVFVSAVLTVFLIAVYIIVMVIPAKAKDHISKVHPEYTLV